MKRFPQTAFVLLILSSAFDQAMAQNPAVTIMRNLSFGSNLTGTTTISYTSASAAEFSVQFPNYGQQGTVSITFILPTNLTDGTGDNLPISFATNSAAYHVSVNSTTGATAFDPNNGLSGTLGATVHTDYFWIGGTVTPGANYTASTYTGAITVVITATIGAQQYTATEVITVSATLVGSVSVSATGSVNFGFVVAGTTPPAISAQSGSAATITATVTRGGGGRITVSYSPTTTLYDSYGNTLTFTPSLYGTNVAGNQAGATAVISGSSLTLSGRRRQTGYYYFWLGGVLGAIPTAQSPGNYIGNFWLTVTY